MSEDKKDTKKEGSILTPKRTVKFFFINLFTLILASMLVWPFLDFAFQGFDTASYTWTWQSGILEPSIFALVFVCVEFIGWNFFHKDK